MRTGSDEHIFFDKNTPGCTRLPGNTDYYLNSRLYTVLTTSRRRSKAQSTLSLKPP